MATTQQEQSHQSRLADQGEIAGVMVHEFNNFLNSALLHVAVLEKQSPPNLQSDLGEIRKQATLMAELIRDWQQYRQGHAGASEAIDLNEAVREAWATDGVGSASQSADASGGLPEMCLARDLAPIRGVAADLRRLCVFLARNAQAATRQGTLIVRTEQSADKIVLRIEDHSANLSPANLAHLFEPHSDSWTGVNALELAACRGLARRLRGKIRAESCAAGGMAIVAEFPR